jgi:hypothetical protein
MSILDVYVTHISTLGFSTTFDRLMVASWAPHLKKSNISLVRVLLGASFWYVRMRVVRFWNWNFEKNKIKGSPFSGSEWVF